MSRAMMIMTVGAAAFAVVNAILSLAVAAWWHFNRETSRALSPVRRARRLIWIRSIPFVFSAIVSLAIVMPSFAIFEPAGATDTAGPYVTALAVFALALWTTSLWIGLRAAARTHQAVGEWLRASKPLDVDPPAGVPAFVIHTAAPIVALVGVFRPKLLAAQSVIDACSDQELNAIVSHERGHLRSRDNLKRWLMACVPDVLRWVPAHAQIVSAWHDAAEDAADDVATDGSDAARADLAALLVKIARLAPEPAWPAAAVSPFVERDGLSRRVTRLLNARRGDGRAWNGAPILAAIATAVTLGVISSPAAMKAVFDVVEMLVGLGR